MILKFVIILIILQIINMVKPDMTLNYLLLTGLFIVAYTYEDFTQEKECPKCESNVIEKIEKMEDNNVTENNGIKINEDYTDELNSDSNENNAQPRLESFDDFIASFEN